MSNRLFGEVVDDRLQDKHFRTLFIWDNRSILRNLLFMKHVIAEILLT